MEALAAMLSMDFRATVTAPVTLATGVSARWITALPHRVKTTQFATTVTTDSYVTVRPDSVEHSASSKSPPGS